MAGSSRPAAQLEVTCGAGTTEVEDRTVGTSLRGVLAHVTGAGAGSGLYLSYAYLPPGANLTLGGGEPVPENGIVTLLLPPGAGEVACQAEGQDPTPPIAITVVDPVHHYSDREPLEDELDCSNPGMSGSAVDASGGTAEAAASSFAELVDAELGARGPGYPDQNPQEFLLEREGKVIGTAQAFWDGSAWAAAWNYVCP